MSSPAALAEPPIVLWSVNRDVMKLQIVLTCCNQIIDDDNRLAWLNSIGLHFEGVLISCNELIFDVLKCKSNSQRRIPSHMMR